MKYVDIYTDGACKHNPGPGGWAAILIFGSIEKELCGGEPETTNNRMELTAVINALSALKEPCTVTIYSDSQYFVNNVKLKRVHQWKANGWRNTSGAVVNVDLWEQLLSLLEIHAVTPVWVKGHNNNHYNERCDRIANNQAEKILNI